MRTRDIIILILLVFLIVYSVENYNIKDGALRESGMAIRAPRYEHVSEEKISMWIDEATTPGQEAYFKTKRTDINNAFLVAAQKNNPYNR